MMRLFFALMTACAALLLSVFVSTPPPASAASPQDPGMKLILCEGIAVDPKSKDAYAQPVRPTKVFSPRGTEHNVFVIATFRFPHDKLLKFVVTDEKGTVVDDREAPITRTHKGTYAFFTIVTPGRYAIQVVDKY